MFYTIIKEMKELYADKRIWVILLTVLIIIIIGTSYNTKNEKNTAEELLRMGVVNKDDSTYSDLLLSYFNDSKTFSGLMSVTIGEEAYVREAFEKGELDVYLVIPEDFAQNMIYLEHSPVKVIIGIDDTTKAMLFQNVLKSYEKYITAVELNAVGLYEIMQQEGMEQDLINETNRNVSIDLVLTALGKETFFDFKPVGTLPATTLIKYYISSMLVLVLLYANLYLGFQLLKEMKQGTLARLRTTKTSWLEFLLAKLLFWGFLYFVFITIALKFISNHPINSDLLVFGIAVTAFCTCYSLLLCACFPSAPQYILAGNLSIFLFTILGGGVIPIQFLPQDMLALSKFTPNYYILKGILTLGQDVLQEVKGIAICFLGISTLLFFLAVIIFSRRGVNYEEA